MVASGSPTVRRRRLAAELRRLRGNRTGGTVAKALGWSTAKISRYELGQGGFPLHEVEKLLDYYGVTEPRRTQLLDLAADANARGWWEDYADVMPSDVLDFIGLEAEADSVAQWQVETIPGLLQTERYAWHVVNAIQSVMPTPPSVIERRVQVRMIRQKVLTERDPPLELSVILDESALLREIGGPDVMYEQLTYLAEASEQNIAEVRILPLRKASSLMASSFVLFGFNPDPAIRPLGDVVSTESLTEHLSVEGETDTYSYRLLFRALAASALSRADSVRLIRKAAERPGSQADETSVNIVQLGGRGFARGLGFASLEQWIR